MMLWIIISRPSPKHGTLKCRAIVSVTLLPPAPRSLLALLPGADRRPLQRRGTTVFCSVRAFVLGFVSYSWFCGGCRGVETLGWSIEEHNQHGRKRCGSTYLHFMRLCTAAAATQKESNPRSKNVAELLKLLGSFFKTR